MAAETPPTTTTPAGLEPVLSGEWWLWALVCATLALDIVTTVVGLTLGLHEANPVVRHVMAATTPLGAMVALKGTVLAVGLVAWGSLPRNYRSVIPLGLALPWLLAGLHNVSLIVRLLL